MNTILETPRTRMRPFELADARAAHWFRDADVMRYIPKGGDETVEASVTRIQRYVDHQNKHGFSKWIVQDKATGEMIGDAGYILLPDGARVELGYRFAKSAWGKGLATEVARAWLSVGVPWFQFQRVFAFAHADNRSSLHVMEKLGFTYSHRELLYGFDAPVYVIEFGRK